MPTEQQKNQAFVKSLAPLLKWIERIATAGFIASLATVFLSGGTTMDIARNVFMASAAFLAGVYFLNAFMPPDFERDENEKFGMKELVLMTILPKVLWISSAICMAGFFVLSQNQEHDAHLNLWFIGGFSLFSGLVILSFAMVTGNKHTRVLTAVAFRAVPLLVLVMYFYLNS
jgi:hypothetical protein